MSDSWRSRTYLKALLLLAGYALLNHSGTAIYSTVVGAPYFWPANALVLTFLLHSPTRQWPLLLLVTVVTEALMDRVNAIPWFAGIGLGLANAVEAGVGAWLARRFIGEAIRFDTLENMIRFLIVVVALSPAASAWIGAAALVHGGLGSDYLRTCIVWWRGDALGLLLVAPVLLTLGELRRVNIIRSNPARMFEGLVVVGGLVLVTTTIELGNHLQLGNAITSAQLLKFPFLIWVGARFGFVACAWAGLAIAVETVWGSKYGAGPFAIGSHSITHSAAILQIYLAVAIATSLALAASISEGARARAALRASEKRLITIGDNLPVLIGYFDSALRFRLGNKTYEDWWGISRETRYGRTLQETDGEDSWQAVRSYVERVRSGEKLTFERDMRPAGVDKDAEVTYIPDVNERGEIAGHYVLAVDITDRKNAARALNELNENLERRVRERTLELSAANHELEAFSYTIAHDLRAPIRHVLGFAELLKQRAAAALDDESRRLLEVIVRSAMRQGKLVDELLTYTQISRQPVKVQSLDVGALIHEIRSEILVHDDSLANVEWAIDEIPGVLGDVVLLRQALTNLLQNAIKFSRHATSPKIEISACDMEPDFVAISIRDNGVGFDMRHQHKLFNVFQRLHSEQEFPGTGIGLAIVKRSIEKQNGNVWAESESGRGATFSFSLKRVTV
jgi:PAS domain S-box-containing protein